MESDAQSSPADPDLIAVITSWATLPAAIKVGIMAMVGATKPHALNTCVNTFVNEKVALDLCVHLRAIENRVARTIHLDNYNPLRTKLAWMLALLAHCDGDLTMNGVVNGEDLAMLLNN